MLPARIEKLEDVAESFRGEYKKGSDGKYTLDVGAVGDWDLQDIKGLKTTASSEREARREWETRATKAEGALVIFNELGDPDKIKADLASYAEIKEINPKKEAGKLAKEITDLWTKDQGSKYETTIKELNGKYDRVEKFLTRTLIESEAVKAIAAEKGRVKPLLPHVLSHTRIREADGEYGVEVIEIKDGKEIPRLGDDGKPMTIAALVQELKKDEDFAGNFEGTRASGAGSGGGNPPPGNRGGAPPTKSIDMIKEGLRQQGVS